jgi:hypothetical protein
MWIVKYESLTIDHSLLTIEVPNAQVSDTTGDE